MDLDPSVRSGADRAALRPTEFDGRRRRIARGAALPRNGETSLILSGWACQQRIGPRGRRHIFSLLLPNDVVGPSLSEHCDVVTLTEVVLETVSPADGAASAAALHRAQARLYDQLARLGGYDAYHQIAHLFLELHQRLTEAGLAQGCRFPFPIGQERIGEMLGLSEVHVNRTLKKMKADGNLLAGPGWYALPHRERLAVRTQYRHGVLM